MKKTFKIMLVIALLLGIGFAVFATIIDTDGHLLLADNSTSKRGPNDKD